MNPFNSIEIEEMVLGSVLSSKERLLDLWKFRDQELFYFHVEIFEAIKELAVIGKPVDIITVSQNVKKYSLMQIMEISSKTAPTSNFEEYIKILFQKSVARKIQSNITNIQTRLVNGENPESLLIELSNVSKENKFNIGTGNYHFSDLKIYESIQETMVNGFRCFKFGLKDNRENEIYFEYESLVLIAAEPSVGKTAVALNLAMRSIDRGSKVAYLNFESSTKALGRRIISTKTGINSMKIKEGKINEHELKEIGKIVVDLEQKPLYLNDIDNSIYSMETAIRELHEQGVSLFFVDNMSNINLPKGERMDLRIGEFLKFFTKLKKELKICIVAITHLSRDRSKGLMQRLRNSGEYEQDGDQIIFLEREEDSEILSVKGLKNRDGQTWEANWVFNLNTQSVENQNNDPMIYRSSTIEDEEFVF